MCSVGEMAGLPADILLGNDLGELNCQFLGSVTQSYSLRVEQESGTESMQDVYLSRIYPITI